MALVALTLLAHPDDAEFLCAGTLIRLADLGWTIHIASMTAGDLGTMTETPWAISARRTGEGARAAVKMTDL
jgi:LmbE family N-acetylglucosaminyl deacetylase